MTSYREEDVTGIILTVCFTCECVVWNEERHTLWHEGLTRVASDAFWGGMLRPLGGPRDELPGT